MKTASAVLCVALGGCASIVSGTQQDIMVKTQPVGARCKLANDKGEWVVPVTPDKVAVHRSEMPLNVECYKDKLLGGTSVAVDGTSDRKEWSALGGGLIGTSIDKSTGAAYAYPETINVLLK